MFSSKYSIPYFMAHIKAAAGGKSWQIFTSGEWKCDKKGNEWSHTSTVLVSTVFQAARGVWLPHACLPSSCEQSEGGASSTRAACAASLFPFPSVETIALTSRIQDAENMMVDAAEEGSREFMWFTCGKRKVQPNIGFNMYSLFNGVSVCSPAMRVKNQPLHKC